MRRADRLFQIIQVLRVRRLTTAADIARELEISTRTVYRDVQDYVGGFEDGADVTSTFQPGAHNPAYWRRMLPAELAFLGAAVGSTA